MYWEYEAASFITHNLFTIQSGGELLLGLAKIEETKCYNLSWNKRHKKNSQIKWSCLLLLQNILFRRKDESFVGGTSLLFIVIFSLDKSWRLRESVKVVSINDSSCWNTTEILWTKILVSLGEAKPVIWSQTTHLSIIFLF